MSTLVILMIGFGLGLLYAKGKTYAVRQFWRAVHGEQAIADAGREACAG